MEQTEECMAMKTRMVGAFASALVAGLLTGPIAANAVTPIDMPGGDAFETRLDKQLEDANAEIQRELRNDPTLADLNAAPAPEPAPREELTIGDIQGVPGDEKFEAALNAWLERQNDELNDELSRDPSGAGKGR
jgi:hypothetical protein